VTSSSERLLRVVGAVLALAAAPVAAAEPPVDAGVAALYVGRERTVEGVVTAAERDGYVVRLTLGEPPGSLRVQLLLGMLSRFPDEPETYYLGKKVRVYGRIGEFRGQAEIILREPDRILVVDDEAPAADPEVGILEDRVRELEERLRTLEGGEPKPAAPEAP
jgi:DNA/RNA endonuclease YhcR with UshA esterase domain